jgi:hypothetical protein
VEVENKESLYPGFGALLWDIAMMFVQKIGRNVNIAAWCKYTYN